MKLQSCHFLRVLIMFAFTTTMAHASLFSTVTTPRNGSNTAINMQDNYGASMDGVEIQQESNGNYVGVYHQNIGGDQFCVHLATSNQLRSGWNRQATVDCDFASQGAIRRLYDGRYLLAYEKNPTGHPYIRVRLYNNLTDLLSNNSIRQFDTPLVPNSNAQGTPNFRWIRYDGNPDTMTIEMGFHFYRSGRDRNAIGFIRQFTSWDYYENTNLNNLVNAYASGNIGDRTFVQFEGHAYTLIEAQTVQNNFATFRLYLHDENANTLTPLNLTSPNGNPAGGNPSLSIVRDGSGALKLFMSYYVFTPGNDGGPTAFEASIDEVSSVNQSVSVTPTVNYIWDARNLPHAVGNWEGDGWSVPSNVTGHMIYGPYETNLPFAPLKAWFLMLLDNTSANNDAVMLIDVYDATAGVVVGQRTVRRMDFAGAFQWQWFSIDFDWRYRNGHQLETRVWTYGKSYIKVNQILVRDNY